MNLIDYAIDMELDGMSFYNKLERTVEGKRLRMVCRSLAKDEENHAIILINKKENALVHLNERLALCVEDIFGDPEDLTKNINYADQLGLYKLALDKEQQSIDHYKNMLSEMPEDSNIYEFLIKQEQEHYSIMEEIVKIVNRPNEWVESAEFGIREEY